MKKYMMYALTVSFVVFLSNTGAFAQRGRGGFGGGAAQGHAPEFSHAGDHGGDHGQAGTQSHTGTQGKQDPQASFVDRIQRNEQLTQRLTALLPEGTDLATAADGFRNQGQFIAALHVSKNLGIPFEDLKTHMTGPDAESLGKAIHNLKPALSESDAKKEASKAEDEAKETEKGTDSTK